MSYFISAFVSGASAIPAGLPALADGDLEGPPTPAGPTPKSKGPVPLMSLTVGPPANLSKALVDAERTSQVRGCS